MSDKRYTLHPINLFQALPPPPCNQITYPTAQFCTSGKCAKKAVPTHSTIYYIPVNQPHSKLIGIKNHRRTYNFDRYTADILKYNCQFTRIATAPDVQIAQDHLLAMELQAQPPTPPATQQPTETSTKRRPAPCAGVNGRFADRHSLRKNTGCTVDACSNCCKELNIGTCRVHSSMAKTKLKTHDNINATHRHAPGPGSGSIDIFINPSQPDQDQFTPTGGKIDMFSRKAPDQLGNFRNVCIRKQAEERTQVAEAIIASKMVTLIVWHTSSNNTPPTPMHVHAPRWPLFSLSLSEDLVALVTREVGVNCNQGGMKVWNEADHLWHLVPLTCIELYNPDCRRLLVVLPNVNPTECHEIDLHLSLVSKGPNKAAMDIHKHVQNALNTPPRSKHAMQTPTSQPPANNSEPPQSMEGTPCPPALTRKKRKHNDDDPAITNSWPAGVDMRTMATFYEYTLHLPTYEAAWNQLFGPPEAYKSSTVSRWRAWLKAITPARLNSFVEQYGDVLAHDAQKSDFNDEWRPQDRRLVTPRATKRTKF
ncbi:hypothetical protein DFH28DRAFT_888091 [Melampsora americana]|nr:hypothetical protein DFH28DRAFT_888091 [Melampsora americana]